MHATMVMVLVALISTDDSQATYEWLRDAQSTNAAAFPRGLMSFEVTLRLSKPKDPIKLVGTLIWDEDSAFWTYKISDPDKQVTGTWDRKLPVEQSRTEYLLLSKQKLYSYNAYTNTLFVDPFEKLRDGGAGFFLWALIPRWHWYHCCPPHHVDGRLWLDMIGPQSRALHPNSKLTVERLENGQFRQIRDDGAIGQLVILFSPAVGGNVVGSTYKSKRSNGRDRRGTYTWHKLDDGRCFLESCEFTNFAPGRPTEVEEEYQLKITSFEPDPDTSESRISLDALKGFLPRDTKVHDRVIGKRYALFPSARQNAGAFDSFSAELRSRGFLKR